MILDKIVETKKQELLELIVLYKDQQLLEFKLMQMPLCLGFINNLYNNISKYDLAIIAEVKKASPSKGIICSDFDHIATAKAYQTADVAAISVLTDRQYFKGDFKYLQDIRQVVTKPLLCKDFIIDKMQIAHARLHGADAILLIARILDLQNMQELHSYANSLGLDCLVEVHDQADVDKAVATNAKLIGVNNRDLQTFATNLKTTESCISYLNSRIATTNSIKKQCINKQIFAISESGIEDKNDSSKVYSYGARGILVGESLMRTVDKTSKINELRDGVIV